MVCVYASEPGINLMTVSNVYLCSRILGMQLLLCIHCIRRLWAYHTHTTFTTFLLCYTAFLGVINTFWMATSPASLQLYIVEWRQGCRPVSGEFPASCPSDWQEKYEWDTRLVDTISVVSYITGSIACDALLVSSALMTITR